jgi:eukaryotic-like serine/threonine-protein kinase
MTTPQHLSDRYEVGEVLGFGGMSEVHLARDLRLHRDVAVKVLRADLARDPSFYLRFRREAQNAAALNHPAIVAVYDTGEAETAAGPLPYIVMEYVDGVTLRDIVHSDGPIPPRKAIEIIADACQALNFSHQHGIIHRDVKPANIMISRSGAVKVMDFGIARALTDSHSVTQTAAVIGTAQYLSPEQARGDSVDARSDVYSLGCVLYEIITGEPPFVGDSPVAVAYQHVREPPVPPSGRHDGIAPELDAVVLKALAKNPDNRYQTAAEMRADLVRVHNGEQPEAPKVMTDAERTTLLSSTAPRTSQPIAVPARPQPAPRFTRKSVRRWAIAVAALTVLTVIVAYAINALSGPTHPVQVPAVKGLLSADATVTLQNKGFKISTQQQPNNTVAPEHVIDTNPHAGDAVEQGSVVTMTVSTGPEQRTVPDVSNLSFADAAAKLQAAGFGKFKQVPTPSSREQNGRVLGTDPKANTSTPVTFEISVLVGTGPASVDIPDVVGQTEDQAKATLTAAGFTNVISVPTDSLKQAGTVIGTSPPAGQSTPKDQVIQIQVSKGNQFTMPDLTGMFWTDVEPDLADLRSQGWTGILIKGADVPGPDQMRNKVVFQSPPANTPVNRDANITLKFGS